MTKEAPPDWNQIFFGPDYYYGTEPNDFLRSQSALLKPKSRILSLAEGEGRNAVYLAGLGHSVHAIDASSQGKTKALELARKKGVDLTYEVCNVLEWPYPKEVFDAVVQVFLHLPPEARQRLYPKIDFTLKPGGHFIAEVYSPRQLIHKTGGPSNPDLLIEVGEFLQAFPGYTVFRAAETERIIREGIGHNGPSAVVQIHLQKPSSP